MCWSNGPISVFLLLPSVFLKKFDIQVKFVTEDDPAAFAAAIDEKTKAIYVESIGNPKYNVSPIADISKVRCSHFFAIRTHLIRIHDVDCT